MFTSEGKMVSEGCVIRFNYRGATREGCIVVFRPTCVTILDSDKEGAHRSFRYAEMTDVVEVTNES